MKKKLLILILVYFSGFSTAAFAQTQTPKSAQAETGVVILKRAYAGFTSQARENGVEGKVVLRVTFKSDGEIGDVIDVTEKNKQKLEKYGLTKEAMKAARKIKFKPATKDGEPVTVTKSIEYVFSVY